MLFDTYTIEEAEQHLKSIQDRLERGKTPEAILVELRLDEFEELLSIAKARLKSEKTAKDLFMLEEDLRFGTNEVVAAYRAKRLACDTLVEIGCGIGVQTIAFAKTCKKVIAVDIVPRKVAFAKANAAKRKITNIEFIANDGLEVLRTLKKADIIFCDPGRPASEDIRDINTSFSPHLPTLIKAAEKITKNIAIELPPQIVGSFQKWEMEYASVNHELNRLTAYLGNLAHAEHSVCVLPEEAHLEGVPRTLTPHARPLKFLYELDEAVVKAQLVTEVQTSAELVSQELFTSMDELQSPFFKAAYRVATSSQNINDIKRLLKRERAGKVILHLTIKPEEYWATRKKFEEGLEGKRVFHVFQIGKEFVVTKKVTKEA